MKMLLSFWEFIALEIFCSFLAGVISMSEGHDASKAGKKPKSFFYYLFWVNVYFIGFMVAVIIFIRITDFIGLIEWSDVGNPQNEEVRWWHPQR